LYGENALCLYYAQRQGEKGEECEEISFHFLLVLFILHCRDDGFLIARRPGMVQVACNSALWENFLSQGAMISLLLAI
jgi:hypothetical protein